ncbi:hypothetical protein ACFLTI_06470 [Bacteroidota bacterium]
MPVSGQETEEREYYNKENNALCLKCHGNKHFTQTNEESEETLLRMMYQELIIDTVKYYDSNHWSFSCTDCHSSDYEEYPHPVAAKFEYMYACMDCHEGDDNVAKYNFEQISEEYDKSHHTKLPDIKYSCWSCHDPHGFRMKMREETVLSKLVAHDNAMCVKCHNSNATSNILLGTGIDNIIEAHDWLPNATNHFKSVRCLECHAKIVDSVLVAHDILPKESAIRGCAECHSSDSRLLYSLYKYEIQSGRMKKGWLGSMVSSDSYVIGANRTPVFNWVSLIVFAGVIFIVLIHITFRIIKK